MSSVVLNLHNSTNSYVTGEKIIGTVECFINSTKAINVVKVVLEGKVKTEWNERETFYDSNKRVQYRNVLYTSLERCLRKELTLLQGEIVLPPGNHTYSFAFVLPIGGIPSSYNGVYGCVRYKIKAIVVRTWDADLVHKIPLQISAPLNLNHLPYLRTPATTSADKTMWSCFCRDKGILVFNMSLPVTGYVPGQEIPVGAYIQNLTNVNVQSVQFKIVQYLEFIARFPTYKARNLENVIATRTEGGVGAHGEKAWTSVLRIPTQGNYPEFNGCSIIDVRYRLKAKVIVAGLHENLENGLALVIGGIPIEGVSTSFTGGPPPAHPTDAVPEQELSENRESNEGDLF